MKIDPRDLHDWTEWRFTSLPINTFGNLDGTLLFAGPVALLASLALGWFVLGVALVGCYGAFLVYAARQRRTPYQQLRALHTIHVRLLQWRAR